MTGFRLLIINTAEKNNPDFTDPILKISRDFQVKEEIIHWSDYNDLEEMNSFDGIIISASPKGDNENFYDRLRAFRWLKSCEKPVLGICAGHQLIGVTFGAELISDQEAEEGQVKINILNDSPLFKGLPETFFAEQHHNDSVSLPFNFTLLASSEKCLVQAMKHKKLPIYSVQWHAEISNPELLGNFISIYIKS